MRRWGILALAFCLLLAGCADDTAVTAVMTNTGEQEEAEDAVPAGDPVAWVEPLEGEAVSPDGSYEIQLVGYNDSVTASGMHPPESVRIFNTRTGEVLWEDMGYYTHSTLWSPDGRFLALARSARTWCTVTFIETENWTSWEVKAPEGGPLLPEYTFLPYDEPWGEWLDGETLLLTAGWSGSEEPQHTYRCSLRTEEGQVIGSAVLEQTTRYIGETWDFDHDGTQETVEVVTIHEPEEQTGRPAWYEARVKREDGSLLWKQDAHWAHMGWTSIFALELEGRHYLLRYNPYMGQGYAAYSYQIFSLNEAGEEVLLKENGVDFDTNFGSPIWSGTFDPAAIAAFLEEVHGYLDNSTLLLSTEGFEFQFDTSGADFQEDFQFWDEDRPYDESKTLEENLQAYAEQGVRG